MSPSNTQLKANVNLLGQYLGHTIRAHYGVDFLDKIEQIRKLAKASRQGGIEQREQLLQLLRSLNDNELLPVSRAFSQFLNLANVVEQHHSLSPNQAGLQSAQAHLDAVIQTCKQAKLSPQAVQEKLQTLDIELVLTAHPTEVTRRTLIHKHMALNDCLEQLQKEPPDDFAQDELLERLEQLINQCWHTNEIRAHKPTPLDEAKWGLAVIEHSLWQALPRFIRRLEYSLQDAFSIDLPHTSAPVRFASWMGGDRDGNPFVTADVTQQVLDLSYLTALKLYEKDIDTLASELSMSDCSPALRAQAADQAEPYRYILRKLRDQLRIQLAEPSAKKTRITVEHMRQPLLLCYESLLACGMDTIAKGMLLDILRRLSCFGLHLVKLDIRQHAQRHVQALSELTQTLGLGDYQQWDETQKRAFLIQELQSQRPLIPMHWQPSTDTGEVIATCQMIADNERTQGLGLYIISMTSQASDILAARLLMKMNGCQNPLPVAPLFETLDDLERAPQIMTDLFQCVAPAKRQWVLIGYSDSAKDAGMLAASWAQYCAMEALVKLARQHETCLTLFHGRGGTIGRGGGPAREAILSQPPGSLDGGLRVTEQGEMIRFKFGLPKIAEQSLALYLRAVFEAQLTPPPEPKSDWRSLMSAMTHASCQHYRHFVQQHEHFVAYFQAATPEKELSQLPLGSRPARRKATTQISDLRAIPWIFAWSQTRSMLPAWLGTRAAMQIAKQPKHQEILQSMIEHWPFFRTRIDMLEMVFLKADPWIAQHYDQCLVPETLQMIGQQLQHELTTCIAQLLELKPQGSLLDTQPWIRESIALRNPYIDPLNLLQVELLHRARHNPESIHPDIQQALMVTIAGIAAGLRNTG